MKGIHFSSTENWNGCECTDVSWMLFHAWSDASETTWLKRPKPIAACCTENHGVNCVGALQAAFLRCEAFDIP